MSAPPSAPAGVPDPDVTALLRAMGDGDGSAAGALIPLVYDDLRGIAGRYLRDETPGHTLQPTAVVHEAFLKLADQRRAQWRDRSHFQAVAAIAMRRLLVDHARGRLAAKRGGGAERVTLAGLVDDRGSEAIDLIALNDVLDRLETLDPRQHRVVELRFFGGLSEDEVADLLGVSRSTVQADWRMAKAWLSRSLRARDQTTVVDDGRG